MLHLIRNSLERVISEFSCITLSSAAIALYLMRHKFGSLGISKLQQSIWDQWSSWNRKFGWNFNCKGNFRQNSAKGQNYLMTKYFKDFLNNLFLYTAVFCYLVEIVMHQLSAEKLLKQNSISNSNSNSRNNIYWHFKQIKQIQLLSWLS